MEAYFEELRNAQHTGSVHDEYDVHDTYNDQSDHDSHSETIFRSGSQERALWKSSSDESDTQAQGAAEEENYTIIITPAEAEKPEPAEDVCAPVADPTQQASAEGQDKNEKCERCNRLSIMFKQMPELKDGVCKRCREERAEPGPVPGVRETAPWKKVLWCMLPVTVVGGGITALALCQEYIATTDIDKCAFSLGIVGIVLGIIPTLICLYLYFNPGVSGLKFLSIAVFGFTGGITISTLLISGPYVDTSDPTWEWFTMRTNPGVYTAVISLSIVVIALFALFLERKKGMKHNIPVYTGMLFTVCATVLLTVDVAVNETIHLFSGSDLMYGFIACAGTGTAIYLYLAFKRLKQCCKENNANEA